MSRLFQRHYELQIDDTLTKDLRCQFKVEASLEKTPNTCEITVTNLSAETRAKAQVKGAFVSLKAGYPGNLAMIFQGDVRLTDHVRKGPDWETKIRAGDGERVYQYAKISVSHKPDTSVKDVLDNIFATVNNIYDKQFSTRGVALQKGNLADFVASLPASYQTFKSGFSTLENAVTTLQKIAGSAGFRFSIQNGAAHFVKITPKREDFKEVAILLNPRTGLIGSPEHGTPDKKDKKPPVLKAVSLLQPQIKVGGLVQLESERTKGIYYCNKVVQDGDTSGGNWYTNMELHAL